MIEADIGEEEEQLDTQFVDLDDIDAQFVDLDDIDATISEEPAYSAPEPVEEEEVEVVPTPAPRLSSSGIVIPVDSPQ